MTEKHPSSETWWTLYSQILISTLRFFLGKSLHYLFPLSSQGHWAAGAYLSYVRPSGCEVEVLTTTPPCSFSVTNILYIRILKKEIPSCMKALWCPSVNPWTPASLAPHNYLQNDGCCGVRCTRWQEFARLLWVWKLFWLLSMGEIYLLNTALRAVLLSQ